MGAPLNSTIARQIHALRKEARLTQQQLARLLGTTASAISRLENDRYDGHSLKMLERIGAALDRRVEVRLVPLPSRRTGRRHHDGPRDD